MFAVQYGIGGALYGPFDDVQDAADFARNLAATLAMPHFSVTLEPVCKVVPLYDPQGDMLAPFRQSEAAGV